jgi:hypothetical protein
MAKFKTAMWITTNAFDLNECERNGGLQGC